MRSSRASSEDYALRAKVTAHRSQRRRSRGPALVSADGDQPGPPAIERARPRTRGPRRCSGTVPRVTPVGCDAGPGDDGGRGVLRCLRQQPLVRVEQFAEGREQLGVQFGERRRTRWGQWSWWQRSWGWRRWPWRWRWRWRWRWTVPRSRRLRLTRGGTLWPGSVVGARSGSAHSCGGRSGSGSDVAAGDAAGRGSRSGNSSSCTSRRRRSRSASRSSISRLSLGIVRRERIARAQRRTRSLPRYARAARPDVNGAPRHGALLPHGAPA